MTVNLQSFKEGFKKQFTKTGIFGIVFLIVLCFNISSAFQYTGIFMMLYSYEGKTIKDFESFKTFVNKVKPLDKDKILNAVEKYGMKKEYIDEIKNDSSLKFYSISGKGDKGGETTGMFNPSHGGILFFFPVDESNMEVSLKPHMGVVTHEILHYLLTNDNKLKDKFYSLARDSIKEHPALKEYFYKDIEQFGQVSREGMSIYLSTEFDGWNSLMRDEVLYPGYKDRIKILDYLNSGNYREKSTTRELRLQELFTACMDQKYLFVEVQKEGLCGVVNETLFNVK